MAPWQYFHRINPPLQFDFLCLHQNLLLKRATSFAYTYVQSPFSYFFVFWVCPSPSPKVRGRGSRRPGVPYPTRWVPARYRSRPFPPLTQEIAPVFTIKILGNHTNNWLNYKNLAETVMSGMKSNKERS